MKKLNNYIIEKLKLDKTLIAKNQTDIDDISTVDDLLSFMNADNIEFKKGNRRQHRADAYEFDNDNLVKFTHSNFNATIVGKIANKYSYKKDNIAIYQSQSSSTNTFWVTLHLSSLLGGLNKINVLSLYIKNSKCILQNHYNYADHTRLTEDLYIKCLQIFAEIYRAIDEYVSKL